MRTFSPDRVTLVRTGWPQLAQLDRTASLLLTPQAARIVAGLGRIARLLLLTPQAARIVAGLGFHREKRGR